MTIEKVAGLTIKVERTGIKEADKALDDLSRSGGTAQKATDRLATSFGVANTQAKKTAGGLKIMRGGMQQVGYQVQDIAVQLGAGQSPFIVLAQQGSQLAGIFGAGGALFGAVLAIGGVLGASLLPALFSSKDATEQLADAAETLDSILNQSKRGVITYTDEIVKLYRANQDAASLSITVAINEQESALQTALGSAKSQIDDFLGSTFIGNIFGKVDSLFGLDAVDNEIEGLFRQYTDGLGSVRQTAKITLDGIAQDYGITFEQLEKINKARNNITDFSSFETYSKLVTNIANSGASDEFKKQANAISEINIEANKSNKQLQRLYKLQEEINTGQTLETEQERAAAKAKKDAFDSLHDNLERSLRLYGETSQAKKILDTVENSGFSEDQKKTLRPIANKLLQKEIDAKLAAEQEKNDAIEKAEKEASQKRFESLVTSLQTENQAFASFYQKRVDLIKRNSQSQGQQDNLLSKLNNQEGRKATDRLKDAFGLGDNAHEKISLLNDQYEQEKALIEKLEGDKTQLLLNLENERNKLLKILRDQAMVETLNNSESLFGSLADISKSFAGEQSGIYKGLFVVSKAFSIAESIIAIQTGIANASALPFPANLGAMATVAANTAGIISTIQSTKLNFAGAYDNGGNIPSGSFGLVGEIGPELIQGPAQVTSRRDTAEMLKGKGSEVTVNIINNAGVQVKQRETETLDGRVLDLFIEQVNQKIVKDIAQGGTPIAKAMEGTYRTLKRGQG